MSASVVVDRLRHAVAWSVVYRLRGAMAPWIGLRLGL